MSNLKTVLDQLSSDKLKERQQGIAALRTTFSRDNAVERLDAENTGKPWLAVFQALFQSVLAEKVLYDRKPTAVSERRLKEATSAVRWLTERAMHRLNRRVIKAVLAQLLEMVVQHGQLFAPVALDYIKVLKAVVSFQAHMDYLDDATWVDIVQLAFNVVLGDSLRTKLGTSDQADAEDDDSEDAFLSPEDEAETETVDDGGDDHARSLSKKRRRPAPTRSRASTPRPKQKVTHAVSSEQVELISVLRIMLRAQSAPLLSPKYPKLASAILDRLQRFLVVYPSETSLHQDYLLALSATLSHLSLNRRKDVETFTRNAWSSLVCLWGTGNKSPWKKEALVAVLRVLFPFLAADETLSSKWRDGVIKLWDFLHGEADLRTGIDGLSMDSLRLEIASSRGQFDGDARGAFVAETFKAGWHFDAEQALAWAMLELQADCTKKLFILSEAVHSGSAESTRQEMKRSRLENPISTLLSSIRGNAASIVRAYHLQVLLFFIDQHFSVLHDGLQQNIINTLLQFVSVDNPVVQFWIFMCLAAIAHVDGSSNRASERPEAQSQSQNLPRGRSRDSVAWDPILTCAIRRANVPIVCRAACHAASVLLLHRQQLLTSSHVMLEIETLLKDIDVQGPPVPYDSVCIFLSQCLGVASQDVRLYRMQLEEKALSWLVDSWRLENGQMAKSKMASHSLVDMLSLLEGICGFSRRSNLVCKIMLPACPIVDSAMEQANAKVIRDFLLDAYLPPYGTPVGSDEPDPVLSLKSSAGSWISSLNEPTPRERRVSSFMLKDLDLLLADREMSQGGNNHPTAEQARRWVDAAALALVYESVLMLNGTRSNRRVVHAAGKLVITITPLLISSKWTVEEQALVLLGLDPLTAISLDNDEDQGWETMLPPDIGTGIKSNTLKLLTSKRETKWVHSRALRRELQRIIWHHNDVQDMFGSIVPILKEVLRLAVTTTHGISADNDGFGPTVTSHAILDAHEGDSANARRVVIETCISLLSIVPVLGSTSGEPTRDKDLTSLVLSSSDEFFFLVATVFFSKVRQKILGLNTNNFTKFLDKIGLLVTGNYFYSRREEMLLLVVHFLRSTLPIWLQNNVSSTNNANGVRDLLHWLSGLTTKQLARSWRVRDAIVVFLGEYLAQDPLQKEWSYGGDYSAESQESNRISLDSLPVYMLPQLAADADIRVRFRAAVVNSRLFSIAQSLQLDQMDIYAYLLECLTKNLDDHEAMLTRMLTLGNIMVVSSALRRGPYWHMLETCLHANGAVYGPHIIAILQAVSERMGLSPSTLFETYASQIAYSLRQAGHDFLRFPPHVLGYQDRKECAENTFRAFTPTNVLAGGPSPAAVVHGQKLFANHCRAIQRTVAEGLRECFGDIIGIQIASCVDEAKANPGSHILSTLDEMLRAKTKSIADFGNFDETLSHNIDGVVAAILRTLSDQDVSDDGPIVQALHSFDASGDSALAFRSLSQYRRPDGFTAHEPNLPAFPVGTVLQALDWFFHWKPAVQQSATTYHVLHQLFADIHRSPLVNEQIRLLTSICLWVAFRHQDFRNEIVLHTLIQGSATLLSQSDLARAVQSILEWSFVCYRKNGYKDPRFPDILIKVSCVAHDYARTEADSTSELGRQLLKWVEAQSLVLCKTPALRGQVIKALPAWSHQPSPELTAIFEDITSETLSALLGDSRISSNKFRLVRRLRDHALKKEYDQDQFSKFDFWRLKACIPPTEGMHDQDTDAFADLLVINHGRIHSFGTEQHVVQTVRERHRRLARKRASGSTGDDGSPQQAIVLSLLATLDGISPPHIDMAYRTLRSLMAASATTIRPLENSPPEYRHELELLQVYPRIPRASPARRIDELLTSEDFSGWKHFPQWISRITVLLSDILSASDLFYAQLTPILRSDVSFAEQMFPVLVHSLIQADIIKKTEKSEASARIILSQYLTSILNSNKVHSDCLRCIVDTILHLRNFKPDSSSDPLAHDRWLDVDFTLLAKNAIACGAYTTALLFLELAAEYRNVGVAQEDLDVEQILFEIYSHIDEPDGFYGIKTKDLSQFLIKRFHHENQWDKAFRFHGAALEAQKAASTAADGLLQSFHAFGFDHLAMSTLQSTSLATSAMSQSSRMSYELGWRTETWDLPDRVVEKDGGGSIYLAIRAVHRERNPAVVDAIVRKALLWEMGRLRDLGSENIAGIRQVTQNLMCLNQITQWRASTIQDRLTSKRLNIHDWKAFINISGAFDFADVESIMATRISLIRSVRQREERDQIGTQMTPFAQELLAIEKQCLVRLSEAAREAHHIQIALNATVRAQKLEATPGIGVSQEFANVLWLQQEQKLAVQFLRELVARSDSSGLSEDTFDAAKKALMLAQLGTWTAEACLEKPTDILTNLFDPAIRLITNIDPQSPTALNPSYVSAFRQCASFAQHQYHAIVKSPDAARWEVYVKRKTTEIRDRTVQLQRTQPGTSTYKKLNHDQHRAELQLKEDKESFRLHNMARDLFLRQAIEMCSRCLEVSDSFDDDAAIRLCSLWFDNFDDGSLQDLVRQAIDRVASRKFVFLAHQLSARMSSADEFPAQKGQNQEILQSLILRMCQEHPFHSLYQVYCLRLDASADNSGTRRHSSRLDTPVSHSQRATAAAEIFDRLRGDPHSRERVNAIETLCNACLEWAKFPIKEDSRYNDRKQKQGLQIPRGLKILDIKATKVPVLTIRTPIDPTLQYNDCIWIHGYDHAFDTAGGVNLPKISRCIGSDGEKYKQLFKGEGEDDLRQDAVMEQVFDLVNVVLRRDRETRRRNLSVRGYKVIPLASQAGVLEFVGNTIPLQSWLHHAHHRYRPHDHRADSVSGQLKAKRAQCKGETEPLVKLFTELRQKFKPVMRHYFTERHKNSIAWFAMRLGYTRSVATTSIVGHVLGLGDRHPSNILLDNNSGEVVHIDLGIAFDQGKLLPVPERVPFRMTADMVDGMGMSGTQGVFQRCAEETLRVLREGSEVITTVLEVFKHDPLHQWTASEVKVHKVQNVDGKGRHGGSRTLHGEIGLDMSSTTADEAADRALTSVARKLDKGLSVEYTVNELIAEATDVENLALIFYGWGPHL